ncbi:MAG: tetratricopeptide repeat protein [Gemmatimonadetes bacterium]|nr:tetratricopeptide repeat protein [Gemmatimonadota bacterium]
MKPKIGVVQFSALCPEGNEHPLACGVTYEIARRLTNVGGVEANAILLGRGERGAPAEPADPPLTTEARTGLSAPSLGQRYESDYILLGRVNAAEGLLISYRLYEAESGRVVRDGEVNGLRSSVLRLLDELVQDVRGVLGPAAEEEAEPEPDPVRDHLEFDAFLEYCLAREAVRPANAMDHLRRALSIAPGFRTALVEYVSLCYQIDDLAESLQLLNTYFRRYPTDSEILIAASNLCLAFHRVEEGIEWATRCLTLRPEDVEPRVIMARFLFAREMPAEASVHLNHALRSRDVSPDGMYCLGRYYLDLGDWYSARNYFEKCLAVDPSYYLALRDLQCCYYELGDFQLGIEMCEKLLEADPDDAGSCYNLGLIYQRLGRTHLAAKYFEEANRLDPSFYKAVYMLGEYELGHGRAAPALARFEEAHRIAPTSAEALGRIGDCHALLGRSREAYRYYVWARREDPLYESARFHLIEGMTLAEDGDLAAARLRLVKATELDEELAEAWSELAWTVLRLGRPEEALELARRAGDLEPDHPALLANLLECIRHQPLGLRWSGWVRNLAAKTRERLQWLESRGQTPPATSRRRVRRFLRSLTWYGLRG